MDYNTYHCYRKITDDFYVINCLFEPQFIDNTFANCNDFNKFCSAYAEEHLKTPLNEAFANRVFTADKSTTKLFYKLRNEYEQKSIGYGEIIRNTISEIIIRTIRETENIPKLGTIASNITKEIKCRYKESITLISLCKELHFSPSYVSAVFRTDTGLTFTQYLQITRINEACNMLIFTDLSVTQIAENVGYKSIKSFNTVFKSITKVTPREYRKANGKQTSR